MRQEQPLAKHDFWVRLRDTVAVEWQEVLGREQSHRLPVRSPIPVLAELPGFSTEQRVYLLALDVIDPSVLVKISERLASKFSLTPNETKDALEKTGIPILEDHVECEIVERFQRWI
jgi:hypothetical protein